MIKPLLCSSIPPVFFSIKICYANPLQQKLLDAFFSANAANLERQYTSQYAFELIRSRSSAPAQIAAHESTAPFLRGTEPPVSDLSSIHKLGTDDEDFENAGLYDLVGFVMSKFGTKPIADSVISREVFAVVDEQSARDGSAQLVWVYQDTKSPRGFSLKVNSARVGFDQCIWAETIEKTSFNVDSLHEDAAKDGVYWAEDYTGREPPPMIERAGVGEGREPGVR